ncbi:MAG: ankyrin repeat domain-containing protein [Thermoanaerobaculia bacterium]|nr:ankyrin repeat domain-containing protein [Thermoanaerobaculia bacterium]
MNRTTLLDRIARGRTDLVFDLLRLPDWREALREKPYGPLDWFVYYGDVTALKAVLEAGGRLDFDLDEQLGHAAFFGHWKVCDFLIAHGADVAWTVPGTGETPLHGALAKAGRPYYRRVVRLLLDNGAEVNARTIPGAETGAFMRDVRTCGETPLHRAAAYADAATIELLLERGADREARDAHGDSPLTWASRHLRPGAILDLLSFGPHRIGGWSRERITSDHGAGWGNGMEWKLLGDYLPESLDGEPSG